MSPEEFMLSFNSRFDPERKIYFREPATCEPLFIHDAWNVITFPEVNPLIISQLEKILQMAYLAGDEGLANICMANTEEVGFEFRTTFTTQHLMDYVWETINLDEKISQQSEYIYIPIQKIVQNLNSG